jgi:hypothetical protein
MQTPQGTLKTEVLEIAHTSAPNQIDYIIKLNQINKCNVKVVSQILFNCII